ncbi:MAG: DUF6428 family protein [Bacteroidia bacterium]
MKLSELTTTLENMTDVNFLTPDGNFVPRHFHLTEIGLNTKSFIDCGGKKHEIKNVVLQLWVNIDYAHRLKANKFLNIINTSMPLFNGEDLDVIVEYQSETLGRYELGFDGNNFQLQAMATDCLATELCGIDSIKNKAKRSLAELTPTMEEGCCTPGGGCC